MQLMTKWIFESAVELYNKVLEIDSNNIDALYGRGFCANFWNKSQGLEDLHRVLEMEPDHEGALHTLAQSYSILGNYDLADSLEMKAIDLNPNTSSNQLTLGRKAIQKAEYGKAIEHLNKSMELGEEHDNWMALIDRAQAYHMLGRHQDAVVDYERCFTDYGFGMYMSHNYEMCGDAYHALGQSENACGYWSLAISNDDPEFDPASKEVYEKAKEHCK